MKNKQDDCEAKLFIESFLNQLQNNSQLYSIRKQSQLLKIMKVNKTILKPSELLQTIDLSKREITFLN